ncbi:MAG: NYN domain-containing protein [Coriobacteriales bacterium]|nr:NYN domain-containing protein [Coriobacteriales bacterium]MBQ6587033.1 NYN domain-containing protein [Coriobacteriales bacterium]
MARILLVDGYNVIRSSHLYDYLDNPDHSGREAGLNAVREALISDVAAFSRGYYDVTIVFDGGGNPVPQPRYQNLAGIKVVFSRAGASADSVIERLAMEARERDDEVLVVSSDANLQWTVMGGKVTRMSAAGFERELKRSTSVLGDDIRSSSGSGKMTLASRIDPKVALALEAMVKGDKL